MWTVLNFHWRYEKEAELYFKVLWVRLQLRPQWGHPVVCFSVNMGMICKHWNANHPDDHKGKILTWSNIPKHNLSPQSFISFIHQCSIRALTCLIRKIWLVVIGQRWSHDALWDFQTCDQSHLWKDKFQLLMLSDMMCLSLGSGIIMKDSDSYYDSPLKILVSSIINS